VEVYVGTSGWLYDWNPRRSLEWYVRHSGLNAVELNASFYRFPSREMVEKWASVGSGLRWAIKVHRSVTHAAKLRGKALETWGRFVKVFDVMDQLIDYYLLQLPPDYKYGEEHLKRLTSFISSTGQADRIAVEFRDPAWFRDDVVGLISDMGAVVVSIDSPIGTYIVSTRGRVYLRMHGRSRWYAYEYSTDELDNVASRIAGLRPVRVHVFFNNDHWMLGNARHMLARLRELSQQFVG